MSGNDVRILQRFLNKDRVAKYKGPISGYYGALTGQAVKRFQKAQYLSVNGRVDTKTLEALRGVMGVR